MDTNDQADVVVIGSGALGASTAWHLLQHGLDVVLVERGEPVSGSSANAAGMGLQIPPDDVLMAISRRSREKLLAFEQDTGQPLVVHEAGSIKVARTAADAALVADELARGRRAGVEVQELSAGRARELAPWFAPSPETEAMWFAPGDVYLDPGALPRGYLAAFAAAGGRVRARTEVTRVRVDAATGAVSGVQTGAGTIAAGHVVLAAGAWNQTLALGAGVPLALWPVRHELCITEPHPSITNAQPAVRVVDAKTYVRPHGGGLMFGGYEARPLPFDLRDRARSAIADVPIEEAPLRELAGLVAAELPLLAQLRWDVVRGGLPTMTPDGHFLVGDVPGAPGLWTIGGCNVAGLSNAPTLGEHLATALATGRRPPEIAPFAVGRFGDRYDDPAALRRACLATYTDKYSADEVGAGHESG